MSQQFVVYLYNWVLFCNQKNELLIHPITWMKLKIMLLSEKSRIKEYMLFGSIYLNAFKCKLIYNDRTGQWLQGNGAGDGFRGEITKGFREMCGRQIYSLSLLRWWYNSGIYISKCINLYILNMCNLLYVNYTSKQFFRTTLICNFSSIKLAKF